MKTVNHSLSVHGAPLKRRLRNQPDRLPFLKRFLLRKTAGSCPVCIRHFGKVMYEPAVIYRRSDHSVTFRCQTCHLQWMMTLASLHRAASTCAAGLREAGKPDDPRVRRYDFIAQGTKFAAENAAARKSTITRQKKRRVIRLPDLTSLALSGLLFDL